MCVWITCSNQECCGYTSLRRYALRLPFIAKAVAHVDFYWAAACGDALTEHLLRLLPDCLLGGGILAALPIGKRGRVHALLPLERTCPPDDDVVHRRLLESQPEQPMLVGVVAHLWAGGGLGRGPGG